MNKQKAQLIIAGCGPGDTELISVKALNAIKVADVILYDALINKDLLNFAKADAIKIYVGKRSGIHILKQCEINRLLVKYSKKFNCTLRLKGGDPFIFGRGYEELEYATRMGIKVEVIPGISSATSHAALSGIPLTCRGINHGFSVVSAVDKYGQLTDELICAAKSGGTTVILMGFNKLREISLLYENFGKGEIPAIVISNGSLITEKKYLAAIGNLYNEIANKKIEGPTTIIVGSVVKLIESSIKTVNNNEYTLSDISKTV